MAAVNMNLELFEKVHTQEQPVLVDFWAPWCGYCRRISTAYEKVADQNQDTMLVAKVNIDEEPELARREHIDVIPTLVLYRAASGSAPLPRRIRKLPSMRSSSRHFIPKEVFTMRRYDMMIIGGGPGGYTAALYAARAGLSTLVLEKLSAGGQMALTENLENYPGFPEGIDGFTLAEQMQQQAERFGAETELADVLSVELAAQPKLVHTSEGDFAAHTVVLATGANPRLLGLPLERELTGRGVHYCAACDGMAYRDKTVVVVGGGNSAVADALLLSRVAKKVILVHRRDALRATKVYHASLQAAETLKFSGTAPLYSCCKTTVCPVLCCKISRLALRRNSPATICSSA